MAIGGHVIARFDSLADFGDYVSKHVTLDDSHSSRSCQNVNGPEALRGIRNGFPGISDGLSSELSNVTFGEGVNGQRWTASVAGSRVSVPAYLAGNPACMRRRTPRESRAVRMFVSTIGNMAVSGETMRARGVAVLGAIQSLLASGVRVELYLVGDIQGSGPRRNGLTRESWDMTQDDSCTLIVPIDTTPLDLSTAGFAITHPAFFRHLLFDTAELFGFHGGYSQRFNSTLGSSYGDYETKLANYIRETRKVLGLGPSDVFIPRVTSADPLLSNPAEWIAARVHQPIHNALSTTDEAAQ